MAALRVRAPLRQRGLAAEPSEPSAISSETSAGLSAVARQAATWRLLVTPASFHCHPRGAPPETLSANLSPCPMPAARDLLTPRPRCDAAPPVRFRGVAPQYSMTGVWRIGARRTNSGSPLYPRSCCPPSATQSRLRTKKRLAVVRSSLHGRKTLCLHTRVLDRPRQRQPRLLHVTDGHTCPLEAIRTHLFLHSSWRCGATAKSQRDSTCVADPAAYGIVEKSTIAETMAGGFWWAYPLLQKWI